MATGDEFLTNHTATHEARPLARIEQYLVELRVCTGLLRDLLLEIKELVIVVSYILSSF